MCSVCSAALACDARVRVCVLESRVSLRVLRARPTPVGLRRRGLAAIAKKKNLAVSSQIRRPRRVHMAAAVSQPRDSSKPVRLASLEGESAGLASLENENVGQLPQLPMLSGRDRTMSFQSLASFAPDADDSARSAIEAEVAALQSGLHARIDGYVRVGRHTEYRVFVECRSPVEAGGETMTQLVGGRQQRFSAFRALHASHVAALGVRFRAPRTVLSDSDAVRTGRVQAGCLDPHISPYLPIAPPLFVVGCLDPHISPSLPTSPHLSRCSRSF